MHSAIIVGIVFTGLVLALAIIGGTILMAIKILRGGVSRKGQADDAKMIQEIYQGLSRMEQRIESLETILLEREHEDIRQ